MLGDDVWEFRGNDDTWMMMMMIPSQGNALAYCLLPMITTTGARYYPATTATTLQLPILGRRLQLLLRLRLLG